MISVIIPTFNRSRLLYQCLNSVLNQTLQEYEVIVVDDGSTDDTESTVSNFSNVRYIQCSHSGMPGKSRNIGAAESSGEWLAFLDSDDKWEQNKLREQFNYVKQMEEDKKTCRLVHTRETWNRGGKIISQRKQKHKRSGDIFYDCLKKCIIGPSTVLMRKEAFNEIGGFDETLEIAEDYELWLRFTDKYPVHYIDKPLTIKRAGDWDQLSTKYGQIEVFRITALEKLVNDYSWNSLEHKASAIDELKRKYQIYMIGLEKRGKQEELENYKDKLMKLV